MGYVLLDPAHQPLLEMKRGRPAFLKRIETLLIIVVVICVTVGTWQSFGDALQIVLNTGRTTGETIERSIERRGGLRVSYHYTVDEVVYKGYSGVSRDLYDAAPNNADLPVLYARHNPSISVLEGVNPLELACTGIMSILCPLALIGLVFSALTQRIQGPSHRILRGTLREISLTKAASGTLWRLEYDFVSPRYKKITGHYTLLPPPHQTPPDVGARLAILYQDDHMHHPL